MRVDKMELFHLGTRMKTVKALGVADPLRWLNYAVKSKLPVPEGIVLLDGGWTRLIDDGVVIMDGDDVVIDSADMFLQRFALNRLRDPVLLRAIPSKLSLTVPPDDHEAIIRAVVKLWTQSDAKRRDILVMKPVHGTMGTADIVISDTVERVTLDDAELLELPVQQGLFGSTQLTGWQRRLQQLCRGVRRTFGDEGAAWQIDWIDDGRTCWLTWINQPNLADPVG